LKQQTYVKKRLIAPLEVLFGGLLARGGRRGQAGGPSAAWRGAALRESPEGMLTLC